MKFSQTSHSSQPQINFTKTRHINFSNDKRQSANLPSIHKGQITKIKRKSSIMSSTKKSLQIESNQSSVLKRQQSLSESSGLPFEMALKQKFEKLYKKVRVTKGGVQIKIIQVPVDHRVKYQQIIDELRNTQRNKFHSEGAIIKSYSQKVQQKPLQICTVSQSKKSTSNLNFYTTGMRRARYRQQIQPLKKLLLTNDIKDTLLSVGKLRPANLNDQLLLKRQLSGQKLVSKQLQKQLIEKQILQKCKNSNQIKIQSSSPSKSIIKQKFNPPFELYYYRDLIWRIGYSYDWVCQTPKQYPFKIKAFIGKGNNSCLIRSILNRRTWYQIVDKIQQANFAWTQIKSHNFMVKQKNGIEHTKNGIEHTISVQRCEYVDNSILTKSQQTQYNNYKRDHVSGQNRMKEDMKFRNRSLRIKTKKVQQMTQLRIHNHFYNNFVIGNKKALFQTMKSYYSQIQRDVFQILPLTFHVKKGVDDTEYFNFLRHYYEIEKSYQVQKSKRSSLENSAIQNVWIVKPGQNTNRGKDIIVCFTLQQIKNIVKSNSKHEDGSSKTFIIQKYIQDPILYHRRKFDIRHYLMIGCHNGIVKGYWYKEGYLRTTSSEFSLKNSSSSVHLTNDAIQKNLPGYGKYQKGNKVSYDQFNSYVQKKTDGKQDFWNSIYPQMKDIAIQMIRASASLIDPMKRQSNFQIFGLDFMVNTQFKVFLIEVNSNPCYQISCPLLRKIIPKLIENTFELFLDPIFPAPEGFVPKNPLFYENREQKNNFELVFDSRCENMSTKIGTQILINRQSMQQQETFQDDGQQLID